MIAGSAGRRHDSGPVGQLLHRHSQSHSHCRINWFCLVCLVCLIDIRVHRLVLLEPEDGHVEALSCLHVSLQTLHADRTTRLGSLACATASRQREQLLSPACPTHHESSSIISQYVTSADSPSLSTLITSQSRSGAQPWAWSLLRAARKQPRHGRLEAAVK